MFALGKLEYILARHIDGPCTHKPQLDFPDAGMHWGVLAGLLIVLRPSVCICRWMTLHVLTCICRSVGSSFLHSCLVLSTSCSSMYWCFLHGWAHIDLRWGGVSNSCFGLWLPSNLCINMTFWCIPRCLTMVVICILLFTSGISLVGAHSGSLLVSVLFFFLFLPVTL